MLTKISTVSIHLISLNATKRRFVSENSFAQSGKSYAPMGLVYCIYRTELKREIWKTILLIVEEMIRTTEVGFGKHFSNLRRATSVCLTVYSAPKRCLVEPMTTPEDNLL